MPSFGYLLPTREVVMASPTPDFAQIIALAERAESVGFDSVWVGDSILARPRLEALTTLAAVAARTTRVRLGTGIFIAALRQPVVLANELANLDIISGGRLTLGFGVATKNDTTLREFANCGVPPTERVGRFDETIEVLRRLWREPEVTHAGKYFRLDGVRLGLKPVQPGGPPIWLAAHVENAFRRVIRLGDGWIPNAGTPAAFKAYWSELVTMGHAMGRDANALHRCVYTTLNINDDEAQAEREIGAFMSNYYGMPFDKMIGRHGMCWGSVAKCTEWLRAFADAGAQTIVVRFGAPDQRAQIDRFTERIRPTLNT